MKFTVALIFTLAVVGSFLTGNASACDQCPNYPTIISTLRVGDIIRGLVNLILRFVVQVLLGVVQQFIPAGTVVPVNYLLSEYAASPCQTLRVFAELTLGLLNLNQFCFILNFLPVQIQNIPIYGPGVMEFVGPLTQSCAPGATVPFPEWSQWVADFVIQSVTNDIVEIFNSLHSL